MMLFRVQAHEYFGLWANHPDATDEVRANAVVLLAAVNALMEEAFEGGIDLPINPSTNSHVAGTQYGGFRPLDCCEGAPKSKHKVGGSVNVYDGKLRDGQPLAIWCHNHQDRLQAHGLYQEHYSATKGKNTCWCHLSIFAPPSGKRVYYP